jgi:hypothetical protein
MAGIVLIIASASRGRHCRHVHTSVRTATAHECGNYSRDAIAGDLCETFLSFLVFLRCRLGGIACPHDTAFRRNFFLLVIGIVIAAGGWQRRGVDPAPGDAY